jgi:hypothetical protein
MDFLLLCTKFMDLKLLRARHGQLIAFQLVPASRLQFCMRAGTFFSTLFSYNPPAALVFWLAFGLARYAT